LLEVEFELELEVELELELAEEDMAATIILNADVVTAPCESVSLTVIV
jgi:hypothetical protein